MPQQALDPGESSSNPPPRRKPGRPKGSKDGPRAPDAPKRGRPLNVRGPETSESDDSDSEDLPSIVGQTATAADSTEARPLLDEFGYPIEYPGEMMTELYEVEQRIMKAKFPERSGLTREQLQDAAEISQRRPFFNHQSVLLADNESDEDGFDDGENSKDCEEGSQAQRENPSSDPDDETAWFTQPKHMPRWLYRFFVQTITPLIFAKDGNRLARPMLFSDNSITGVPGSLWLHPPDPIMSLHRHRFEPELLYRPRVFFWFPHFFVSTMNCPNCRSGVLEKNGACPPRRIVDVEDVFWIITWSYYCRKGCQSHFRGWHPAILKSLPTYISRAFPAVLSRKSGLSHAVITLLRVGNQHKMGPGGVRSLLLEMHTRKFNIRHVQYLEAVFELVRGRQEGGQSQSTQSTLFSFLGTQVPSFGDFSDPEKYGGFVSSEFFLAQMMNLIIERDEADANQHTSCLDPDQLKLDDSHKVIKHIAKIDGVSVFNALWTCMGAWYIRAQALTLTKAHEERKGPLKGIADSIKRYGYSPPKIAFSDDPLKDKGLLHEHFPTLAEKLTPMAAAHGLVPISLSNSMSIVFLGSPALVESALLTILAPLEESSAAHICISIDAEWNISRTEGVSIIQIAPHSHPNVIFIIPVHRFKDRLPASLLRLLISKQIFKIGSGIKGDITRLQKQFPQLVNHANTNLIDLKEFCIARGLLTRKESGSLDALCEKVLGMYLEKPDILRKHEKWEDGDLTPELRNYAALDVYSSRLVFEKASERVPIQRPSAESPPGTPVTLLLQEGGDPIAHGRIAQVQPATLGSVRVKTPSNNRVVIDVDVILNSSAAVILHTSPISRGRNSSTKSGALTLGELRNLAPSGTVPFQIVTPISSLDFYRSSPDLEPSNISANSSIVSILNRNSTTERPSNPGPESINSLPDVHAAENDDDGEESHLNLEILQSSVDEEDGLALNMLEARTSLLSEVQKGKRRTQDHPTDQVLSPESHNFIQKLQKLVNSPPDIDNQYTRIKKDIFHAFHMITTPVNHGLRASYSQALRDHIMRWDPNTHQIVDETCRRVFNLTFDQMLARNPRFIMERTPRYVPPPSILVPAISHVFNTFGNALDAKTGAPLFNKAAWQKAHAVLDLAREGYLSDNKDIVLYEKAGIDKYGLQKWKCLRGTNSVEGGPHGDIYRKFGALNAGPRLTVNCLTDHRTWYNLQAYATHLYGVDWEYHHDLALINRTHFLLNYLSDVVGGVRSYSDWINGDLYEPTTEQFGICKFPESLRRQLGMEPFDENTNIYELNPSDDWLRRRQDLALPVIPPTTPEARRFFFSEIANYAATASNEGKKQINYIAFTQDWNRSADGKSRFYVTPEVLTAYAKTWEKNSNIKASRDLITDALDIVSQTTQVFSAVEQPFPTFLMAPPSSNQPMEGVLENTVDSPILPSSISTSLAISRPAVLVTPSVPDSSSVSQSQSFLPDFFDTGGSLGLSNEIHAPGSDALTSTTLQEISTLQDLAFNMSVSTSPAPNGAQKPKRRRVVADGIRKRSTIRTCRRCRRAHCPGNSDILNCPVECTTPCATCGRTTGCRGVDKGKKCTAQNSSIQFV